MAVMHVYGEDFDRVLRAHGTDRDEVLARLDLQTAQPNIAEAGAAVGRRGRLLCAGAVALALAAGDQPPSAASSIPMIAVMTPGTAVAAE